MMDVELQYKNDILGGFIDMRYEINVSPNTYDRVMNRMHDSWTLKHHNGYIFLQQAMNVVGWFLINEPIAFIGKIQSIKQEQEFEEAYHKEERDYLA